MEVYVCAGRVSHRLLGQGEAAGAAADADKVEVVGAVLGDTVGLQRRGRGGDAGWWWWGGGVKRGEDPASNRAGDGAEKVRDLILGGALGLGRAGQEGGLDEGECVVAAAQELILAKKNKGRAGVIGAPGKVELRLLVLEPHLRTR